MNHPPEDNNGFTRIWLALNESGTKSFNLSSHPHRICDQQYLRIVPRIRPCKILKRSIPCVIAMRVWMEGSVIATHLLPAIPQPRGYAIDGEVDGSLHQHIVIPCAMALQQAHLQVIERVYVGGAGQQAARESGIVLQQGGVASHGEQRLDGGFPFAADRTEDALPQLDVFHQFRVA